jgi:hypothetical protein
MKDSVSKDINILSLDARGEGEGEEAKILPLLDSCPHGAELDKIKPF